MDAKNKAKKEAADKGGPTEAKFEVFDSAGMNQPYYFDYGGQEGVFEDLHSYQRFEARNEDEIGPYDNTQNSSYLDLYSQQVL